MGFAIKWLARLTLASVTLLVIGGGLAAYAIHHYSRDLPDYRALAEYAPPTVTRVHAGDGRLLAEYARERRVFVPIEAIPDRVANAFIAAEDQNFRTHPGIDPLGIARAAVNNVQRLRNNQRMAGASTITQQVAKNFLLTNEYRFERKAKEAILALRMEQAFTKDHILELYLNEIFLGKRSYGVAAAALNYFDKSLGELTISEAAFLAGLPKAPTRYDPDRNLNEALIRRDYVIGRMEEDGYITAQEADEARAETLETAPRTSIEYARADFFTEEVRRRLVGAFGEDEFYEGGWSVRTTVDPELQAIADEALREGLARYDREWQGYRGPVTRLDLDGGEEAWLERLREVDVAAAPEGWRVALVLETDGESAKLALKPRERRRAVRAVPDARALAPEQDPGEIEPAAQARGVERAVLTLDDLRWARSAGEDGRLGPAVARVEQVLGAGDVVLVEEVQDEVGSSWALRQIPEVEGAIALMNPHTGRVLALSGGFSFAQSKFNRATQALRQPGSSFKPFVYLAALEQGYTPASIVLDAPVVIDQGPGKPEWRPENYSEQFYGPSTLRLGLEKSRNLMTVRLAQDIGMDKVQDVGRRFGVERGLGNGLASSLGSNEVTVLQLASAYAALVNGGLRVEPQLVERVQDRFGRTVMAADPRDCAECRGLEGYLAGPPPALDDYRPQVVDARHAYQVVHMLEGVVERGTAARARAVGKPLAGKTGTTNDSKDAWFVGFAPDLVAAVWVGFDQPKSLGKKATGSNVALPIWVDVMNRALDGEPATPFRTPQGIRLVRVDAETGLLPSTATRAVVAEAFLPGTEPRRRTPAPVIGVADTPDGSSGGSSSGGLSAGGLY